MAHAESLEALVLKTYDTGEADRFCVLFTRERGRIAAKAAGARRPKSKLGGLLLPFRHLELRAEESRSGWVVTGAVLRRDPSSLTDLRRFSALQEIAELLLRLVPHEGALPDVFDAVAAFFGKDSLETIPFTFHLLHLLGLLPGDEELAEHFLSSEAERRFINHCRNGSFMAIDDGDRGAIERLKTLLLEPHLTSPLKAAPITAMLG